jgi:serine/threonine protein phosphatase PrpC
MFSAVVKIESGGKGEDRAAVRQAAGRLVIVVADGAGGSGAGASAAQTVCDVVVAQPYGARPWTDVLREIDGQLSRSATGGQTTAVVLDVFDSTIMGASVGDSGAWLIGEVDILDLTERQHRKPLLGSGLAHPVPFGPTPFTGRLLIASDGLFKYARRAEIRRHAMGAALEGCVLALIDSVRLRSGGFQDDVSVVLAEEAA